MKRIINTRELYEKCCYINSLAGGFGVACDTLDYLDDNYSRPMVVFLLDYWRNTRGRKKLRGVYMVGRI